MVTVGQIVNRAYRKIGVSAADEALSADQMAQGVDALNMMLAAWRLAGVDTATPELTSTSPFPLQTEFQEGAVYNLASRLSPDFNVPAAFDADDWFRKIQASYMHIDEAKMPLAMRRTMSQRRVVR